MELVEFWSACDLETSPFVHPDDEGIIAEQGYPVTLLDGHRAFVGHPTSADSNDQSLHLSFFPVPFQRDLSKADIFVVMLNPGLGVRDDLTQEDQHHTDESKKILRQDLVDIEYPFLSLNPRFAKKLRAVLRSIAEDHCGGSYVKALQHLSRRMACIECFRITHDGSMLTD